MAGIGDYIHYWSSRYEEFGIERGDGESAEGFNPQQILEAQKQKMLSRLSKNKKYLELETFLNSVLYPPQGQNNEMLANDSAYRARIENLMKEISLKWATVWDLGGSVFNTNKKGQKKGIRLNTLSNLKHLKEQVERELKSIGEQSTVKGYQDKKAKLDLLIDQIKTLEKASANYEFTGKNKDYLSFSNPKNKGAQDLVKNINNSIQNISNASRYTAIGTAFEAFLGAADDRVRNSLKDYVDEEVRNSIMTGTNLTSKMQGAKINSDIAEISKTESLGNGEIITLNASGEFGGGKQIKMDVNLLYDQEQFRISAKSSWFGKDVNIMSTPTPLLKILQKTTDENFINHFLNITTTRGDALDKNLIGEAHKTAKMAILLEGLAGISQKEGYADTFAINVRSKRKILIRSIHELVTQVENQRAFSISGYKVSKRHFNHWVGKKGAPNEEGAYRRIARLLLNIQKSKIKITLKNAELIK